MSVLLLEKLQKKPVPKDIEKPVAIKLGSEQVDIQITIEDQSGSTNFDVNFFKERIKRRGLATPKIQEKVGNKEEDEEKQEQIDVPVNKPKKLKKTRKLPGKKREKKEKESESVVLSVPAESIMYQDIPLGDRLKIKVQMF